MEPAKIPPKDFFIFKVIVEERLLDLCFLGNGPHGYVRNALPVILLESSINDFILLGPIFWVWSIEIA